MSELVPILEVYEVGPTTIVGFGGRDVSDLNLAICREELRALMQIEACEVLAVDLEGVKMLPSGLLGLLASAREFGAEVHLYNPSDDVTEVLRTTHLDQLMPVHRTSAPQQP